MGVSTDPYTLNCISLGLERFRPHRDRFDPGGNWQLSYGLYSAPREHIFERVGTIQLERRRLSPESSHLSVLFEKKLPADHTCRVAAELECRSNPLSAPVRWKMSSRTVNGAGDSVPNTNLDQTGEQRGDEVIIRTSGHTRRIPMNTPYTVPWALWDAVQRLPRKKFEPQRFTLLDRFDEVKPNQVLRYRGTGRVSLGGEKVTLHTYGQSGVGVVPWEYWVDCRGRLLFAIGGIEVYVLDTAEKR